METKEYTTLDKSSWPRGPWDNEPDKVQWQDEKTGLPCLAVRNSHAGNWCGYVGVSEGHPDFAKNYSYIDVDVHGGITFGDFCQDTEEESKGICHLPAPGDPDRVFWFGFDCAHYGDCSPSADSIFRSGVYRDLEYVMQECRLLAGQLALRATTNEATTE